MSSQPSGHWCDLPVGRFLHSVRRVGLGSIIYMSIPVAARTHQGQETCWGNAGEVENVRLMASWRSLSGRGLGCSALSGRWPRERLCRGPPCACLLGQAASPHSPRSPSFWAESASLSLEPHCFWPAPQLESVWKRAGDTVCPCR